MKKFEIALLASFFSFVAVCVVTFPASAHTDSYADMCYEVVSEGCCKICTVGQACGDTCISRDKVCHVIGGCACNG